MSFQYLFLIQMYPLLNDLDQTLRPEYRAVWFHSPNMMDIHLRVGDLWLQLYLPEFGAYDHQEKL